MVAYAEPTAGIVSVSITLLRTLVAIADEGSFVAAADVVNLTQAAVGQQMKRLEESLHVSLFDRDGKSPQLNPLARALVPKARELIAAYDTLLDDLTGEVSLHGEFTLGAVPSTLRALVPLSVRQFVDRSPGLKISVVPGLSVDLHELVERGAVDAAILSQPTNIEDKLEWQPFASEPLVLLCAPDTCEKDPLVLLKKRPYIRHTRRAAVGQLADQWLGDRSISVHGSMEMESLESVASMVQHDLGVSIVPDLCVADSIFQSLVRLPLPEPRFVRTLGLLTRADSRKHLLINAILEQLENTVANS